MNSKFLNSFVLPVIVVQVMIFSGGCGSSRTVISCLDAISLPNRDINLRAKLERRNINLWDIESQPVEFKLLSAPRASEVRIRARGMTDEDGWVTLPLHVSAEGLYRIRADYRGSKRYRSSQDEFTVLVLNSHRPVLILDIDGTLTRRSWTPWRRDPLPYDSHAAQVVRDLSKQYAIVYISGRIRPLHNDTRKWLKDNGFPRGPVLLWWISKARWIKPENYKKDVIASLRREGINLVAGIGNTHDDMDAYRESGLKSIILAGRDSSAIRVNSWNEISELFRGWKTEKASRLLPSKR